MSDIISRAKAERERVSNYLAAEAVAFTENLQIFSSSTPYKMLGGCLTEKVPEKPLTGKYLNGKANTVVWKNYATGSIKMAIALPPFN